MQEIKYSLTFKGLLSNTIKDQLVLQKTLDSIELYLRRHHSKDGVPAIVLENNNFHFVTLSKNE